MRILIAYASLSGNTRDLARSVRARCEALGHAVTWIETDIQGLAEAGDDPRHDLYLLGAWTDNAGRTPPEMKRFIEDLVAAGCREISVDEPSMSCYAYKEDPRRFVDIFNRTVETVHGRTRLCTHLCFGNYKGRAIGPRRLAPMFPAFLDFKADEMHVEMASREYAEIEIISQIAERMDAAVGIIDVKSYYLETPENIADRVRLCLRHAAADRLVFAPDCGLSQTARWAAQPKLRNMVAGIRQVRKEIGL
jgi:5-methyltetrahydropteroyltriglutamate--homocysteine methyltransferase